MKLILFANTDWYLYNFRRSLIRSLTQAKHEVLLVSPPGPYGERLQALGFRWVPAPMRRASLNPLREVGLLIWLWRLARNEKPDLIHGFTIKCAVYGGLIARIVGAARVSAVTGMGYVFISDGPKARLLRPVVGAMLRLALGGARARLILQNPDDVSFFERSGLMPSGQLRLIGGSGVDCTQFLAPTPAGEPIEPRPLRVVLAARMLWDKGIAEFVAAARLLRAQNRALQFILAGDPDPGNPASIPEKTLLEWKASGLVEWLGHVEDMPGLLAEADIVVLPSYREGLSKTLIEAAACERPLITTDVPGCRDVVTDNVTGLLVPARNAEALALAIARLQDDPALARRLGQAARENALLEFDERIVTARTLAVYDEVAGSPSRSGGMPLANPRTADMEMRRARVFKPR